MIIMKITKLVRTITFLMKYMNIYNLDDKVQDDLDLIALVESNPRLYDKRRNDYKNVKDRDMAWESIGNALRKPMNDAKHRWEILRNLYGRARRQFLNIDKENCLSGSGQINIVIENMLTLQSKAIHRFLGKLYVPRKRIMDLKDEFWTFLWILNGSNGQILDL